MSTPELVVELPVLDANIARLQAWADARGRALRPHAKTHKSLEIARRQVDAGAVGLTVATVGEAEVFARVCDDLFIAYPLWLDDSARARLASVTERGRVRVGVDSVDAARRLVGLDAEVMVEIDSGHHRTGVAPDAAGGLAGECAALGLAVAGVFTFPGHSYAPGAAVDVATAEARALADAAAGLRAAGIAEPVVSGGSTPSIAAMLDGPTEARPGVYVFNDAQQWELGTCSPDQIALTCHARVVSHAGGRLVLDSGSKALGADRAPWASGFGRLLDHEDARIVQLSEHHAVVEMSGRLPALGSIVRVVPNHVCNAVNLADALTVTGGVRGERWSVDARGKNC